MSEVLAKLSPDGRVLLQRVCFRKGQRFLEAAIGVTQQEIQSAISGNDLALATIDKIDKWLSERTERVPL